VRRFVLIGQTASASGNFSLEDLPGSSGRLDVLLRSVRAALLVSHGLRRNVLVYLVLRGGGVPSRLLRIDGRTVKFLRPDERSLAILLQKTLSAVEAPSDTFSEIRPGLELRAGDVPELLAEVGTTPCYLLHEDGQDIRAQSFSDVTDGEAWFFIGDHLGFDPGTLASLEQRGCRRVSVGPVSVHSDDVVTLISNELDRRFRPPFVLRES
jgi:tRNA (pseudouridine54-N1)-methyltransferase